MANEEKKNVKVKRPQALKRDLQNEKQRLRNKMDKSQVKTAINQFKDAVVKGDEALKIDCLNKAYSLLDKCAKKGVYKVNKASRLKSRLAAFASAKS